jgi:hypothetical protein
MDIAERLQRLEDIEAIKQLIARYATAADHNADPAMMAPCFTEDAVWNCEGIGRWEGRDTIVSGLREVSTTQLSWALHYMTQPIDTWIGGWYESKFRKEGGDWKFCHIELILKLLSPANAPSWETPIPPWKP